VIDFLLFNAVIISLWCNNFPFAFPLNNWSELLWGERRKANEMEK
jgi:hypothetical protein